MTSGVVKATRALWPLLTPESGPDSHFFCSVSSATHWVSIMSISQRVSIAWAPLFSAGEDTDTLVLTGRTYFVDQRVLKSPSSPSNRIDWAFAGKRLSSPSSSGSFCRWEHWIDSRSLEPAADEGYMFTPHPQHPNDPTLSLEKGEMPHPETGEVTAYEEVWKDLEPAKGSRVTIWEREAKEGERGTGAMVAMIGQDAQGVGREIGASVEEFWTWRARLVDGKWGVVFAQPEGAHIGLDLLDRQAGDAESRLRLGEQDWILRENWTVS